MAPKPWHPGLVATSGENAHVTLQRSLLLLIGLVLLAGLLPAGILLDRRLVELTRTRAREDLAVAPGLLAEVRSQSTDAMMMRAKDVSVAGGLAQALLAGDVARAVELAQTARGGYGEDAVLVAADGRTLAGPSPPEGLLEITRTGQMPVEVVPDAAGLRTIALAPVKIDGQLAGIAGVTRVFGETQARALAGVTRTDVLLLRRDGAIAAATFAPADTGVIAAAARELEVFEGVLPINHGGRRLLASAAPLGDYATVIFIRDLDRDEAFLTSLRRAAAVTVAIAAAFALLIGALYATRLARPVGVLADAADRLAGGDFDAPLGKPRIREVGRVADAFDDMRSALAARLEELARTNRELEDRQARLAALQSELIQRDRLATASHMVAQLAHEIRNPVANVRNCLELLRRRLTDDAEAREFADLAIDELLRMHELAEHMLDLHRPREGGILDADVATVAAEVVALMAVAAPDSLSLRLDMDPSLRAAIPPDALKQVLLNVVQNAREASRDRATIRITGQASESTLDITIEDDGPGIPAAVLPRVFDPFFTTKGDVRGVGLGLFVAEGIVRGAGGRIAAANRDDVTGARFTITLPVPSVAPAAEMHRPL